MAMAAIVLVLSAPVLFGLSDLGPSRPVVAGLQGSIALMLVWGLLALGTASLETHHFPAAAVALWTLGLSASAIASSQIGQILGSVGVLWAGIILWRGTRDAPATPQPAAAAATSARARLVPVDALRGTLMALMAIDHASLFIRRWHPFETWDQPLPDYASVGALITRLVTHPCAPGFFFLMGVGMSLFADARGREGWSPGRVARSLMQRGLLFVVLEQVVVDPALSGRIDAREFSILSGLGVVMILSAAFLRWRGKGQVAVGAALVLAMQVLPGILLQADLRALSWVRLFLVPGSVGGLYVLYAPIPWLGVTLFGMAFGGLLLKSERRSYRLALAAGVASLVLFAVLRGLGGFGNLRPPEGIAFIDYFNLVKYPPSLTFLLLTLGVDLVLLFGLSKAVTSLDGWARPLVILGRAALWFFLIHWTIYRAIGAYFPEPAGLAPTYLAWVAGLALLYPICRSFEAFKHRSAPGTIWRLL